MMHAIGLQVKTQAVPGSLRDVSRLEHMQLHISDRNICSDIHLMPHRTDRKPRQTPMSSPSVIRYMPFS